MEKMRKITGYLSTIWNPLHRRGIRPAMLLRPFSPVPGQHFADDNQNQEGLARWVASWRERKRREVNTERTLLVSFRTTPAASRP